MRHILTLAGLIKASGLKYKILLSTLIEVFMKFLIFGNRSVQYSIKAFKYLCFL